MNKVEIGRRGEALAVAYLKKNGYRVLQRNVRMKFGEIDLVARDGNVLCFVEIKARSSVQFGWPEEGLTPEKQRRLGQLALGYLKARRLTEIPVRFDVVSVLIGPDGSGSRLRLIKGAFEL